MTVRHPSLVTLKARPNASKHDKPQMLTHVGFDIETNFKTGEPMLMGWNSGGANSGGIVFGPQHNKKERLARLILLLKRLQRQKAVLVSWSTFDHIALFRLILETLSDEERERAVRYHGLINPCVETDNLKFSVFKGMVCLEVNAGQDKKGKTVWKRVNVMDAKRFYYGNLEQVTHNEGLTWFDKGPREMHLIDWNRYNTDKPYAEAVRKYNLFDARAAALLAKLVHENFNASFGKFAGFLGSSGTLAKACVAALTSESDYDSVNLWVQDREWQKAGIPHGARADVFCMAHEAYSGGLIDAFALGNFPEAWTADIASAYPDAILQLPDFRGSTVIHGKGDLPDVPLDPTNGIYRDLVMVRCVVDIPADALHTVSYRVPGIGCKARAVGKFRATTTLQELAWLKRQGTAISEVEWVWIKTLGKPNPVAAAAQRLLDMRQSTPKGTSRERFLKEGVNAIYGITYEVIPLHEKDAEGNVIDAGQRTGELYNPVLATFITALTRLKIAQGIWHIREAGGTVISAMTDSIAWTGRADMLPTDYGLDGIKSGIRTAKTVGYFEPPEKITECLWMGTGRYEYKSGEKLVQKARGYRFADPEQPKEEAADSLGGRISLRSKLRQAVSDGQNKLVLPASQLISPGIVRNRSKTLEWSVIGKVLDLPDGKDLWPLQLGGKRILEAGAAIGKLVDGHVLTRARVIGGLPGYVPDNTLPEYRLGFFISRKDSGRRLKRLSERYGKRLKVGNDFLRDFASFT